MSEAKNTVVFGAGAIGLTVACWLSEVHKNTYLLARGEALASIQCQGALIYQQGQDCDVVSLNTIENLNELDTIDVIIVCVKTYSLEGVLQKIKEQVGNEPLIVAIQNGVENQIILPKYFSKVIYGVAQHNAWIDNPGEVGFSEKTDLILGMTDDDVSQKYFGLVDVLSRAMPVVVTREIKDAAHNKLLANLINSILSLTGQPDNKNDLAAMQEIFIRVLMESIDILEKNGISEFPIKGLPGWRTLKVMSVLPRFLTRQQFREGVTRVHMTSMQQDIRKDGGSTELDFINGALLKLADKADIDAPYSRALYEVCRGRFSMSSYAVLPAQNALEEIQQIISLHDVKHKEKFICREGKF